MRSRGSTSSSSASGGGKRSGADRADRESDESPEAASAGGTWLPIGAVFLLPFLYASFFPDGPLWGFSGLAVLPLWLRVSIVLLSFGFLVAPATDAVSRLRPPRRLGQFLPAAPVAAACMGVAFLMLFRRFPIATDMFGDHRNMLTWFQDNSRFDPEWWTSVVSPSFYTTKEVLSIAVGRSTAYLFHLSIAESYIWIAAVSGALLTGLWILLVIRSVPDPLTAATLIAAGVFAGGNLVFFGHVENYPFAAMLSFAFLTASYISFFRPLPVWAILVLFLVAFRAHALNGLLAGGLAVTLLHAAARRDNRWKKFQTWRVTLALLLPLIGLAALIGFVIVRRDHPDLNFFELILPVRTSPPPHGNYLLQSPAHALDFLNLLALIGLPALAVVAGMLLMHRREIDMAHPRILWAVMSLAIPLLFFFALNTQLGPERDWDIFALLSPPILFLALALATRTRAPLRLPGSALGVVLALSVFPVAGAAVNAVPELVSRRLQSMGEWAYRSYYTGSAYLMVAAIRMDPDRTHQKNRLDGVAKRLKPYIREYDTEYSHILAVLAEEYSFAGDAESAIRHLERSVEVCPRCDANRGILVDAYLDMKKPDAARPHVEELRRQKPESLDVLRRSLLVAMMTGRTGEIRPLYEEGLRLGLTPEEQKIVTEFLALREGTAADSAAAR